MSKITIVFPENGAKVPANSLHSFIASVTFGRFLKREKTLQFDVKNVAGALAFTSKGKSVKGSVTVSFTGPPFPTGVYVLTVTEVGRIKFLGAKAVSAFAVI